jgi:hypothetical protein
LASADEPDPDPDRPTKVCPDCAETVLAAARKCRFCGYRFDGAQPETQTSVMDTLFRRRSVTATPAQTLAAWNVPLEDDEEPVGFWLGSVDGVEGFVAVTDRRMIFAGTTLARAKRRPPVRQHPLGDLVRVEVARRRLRTVLELEWRSEPAEVLQLGRRDRLRLQEALQAGRGR